jgi:hypothetical protein
MVDQFRGPYLRGMNLQAEDALRVLSVLGFKGRDVYLAELIPAVEMAWADGEIQPNERAMLEAYCETLVERLNQQAGANFFSVARAKSLLERLSRRRLRPAERQAALFALKTWSGLALSGAQMRKRMLEWAEAVAAVDGSPVWDTRELFWLQSLKRNFDTV